MADRLALSDSDEEAERSDREALRRLDAKVREARGRRLALVTSVRELASEQKRLYDERAPRRAALEALNQEHHELGRTLATLRGQRDAARRAFDEALGRLREHRALAPRGERARPEQIAREISVLEMQQQTRAMPLTEENAVVLRLRALTKELTEARRHAGEHEARAKVAADLETAVAAARAEVDRLGLEMSKARTARERAMQGMRDRLVEEGRLVAEMREKGRLRAEAMARLEAGNREVESLEREGDRLVQQIRSRRHEAHQTVRDYNRTVRQKVAGPDAYTRAAEEQLQELLKRGRVTLGG